MNKKLLLFGSLLAMACQCGAENYFNSILGKSEEETRAKVESVWNHFFTPGDLSCYDAPGQKSLLYIDGDDAFIMDTGSNDVRTEGMSYGMMISAQLGHQDVFEKLWNWSKRNMAFSPDSPWDGYFCWHCTPDGRKIGRNNASDGELYYITALFIAGKRWEKPEYIGEANTILKKIMSKDGEKTGIYDLFDRDTKMITFVADKFGHGFTDPSYHLPAFLDYWAICTDVEPEFWTEAATAARNHLYESSHPITGLHPDYSQYDGQPLKWAYAPYDTSIYMYDAVRCAMNIGMDYYLSGKDKKRQTEVMGRMLNFFKNDDFNHRYYSLDGSRGFEEYSCGMAGANGVGALALVESDDPSQRELAKEYLQMLWDAEPPTGKFRYYEGLVYFLSLLHASGNFALD